ncbi:initiation factor 4F subunit [Trifolium repens]|nr:initiation factor 4F subunit [Trifolium repens]
MATSSFLASNFKFTVPSKNPRIVSATARTTASDIYVGRDNNSKIYNTNNLDSCLVIPPPTSTKPRAIIKFIGGAFFGAIPQLTYSYLIELLAKEGFVVVLVPYNVTFDHSLVAKQVYDKFHTCLDTILTNGLPQANLSPAQLEDLPIFSVGHSNGALLQVLIGSLFSEKLPKANAVIAYNNKLATETVPYLEQLGPAASQMMPVVEANPIYSIARTATGDAWKMVLVAFGSILQESEQEVLNSLTKFVDQLSLIMSEVAQGVSEFKPTPSENRDCFKTSYNVKHTLLVKFNSDTTDETNIVEETLKPRVESFGGTVEKVELSGNHITPCIQEPRWQVGKLYTPADVVAQKLKSLSLSDIRILATTISDWFKQQGKEASMAHVCLQYLKTSQGPGKWATNTLTLIM